MSRTLEDDKMLARLKELILHTCGFSLEMGREQTLLEGLRTRTALRGVDGLAAYHAMLEVDREELNSLVELLTVNETYFFREPDYLNLVADKLLPEFLKGRCDRQVRILSAGCSTGEEPYSIAMMLRERYGADSERLFAVTGVDIDSSVIASARNGVYGKSSFRGMDQGIMQRYFDPCGTGKFQVRESVGKLVGFEVVNLLGDSYPERMSAPDIVFYRNVSIYFPQEVQRKIFSRLAGLLNEGGYLVVGATETIHHDIGVLSLVERDALFYYRKTPAPIFEERRGARRNEQVLMRPAAAAGIPQVPLPVTPLRPDRAPQATPTEGIRKDPVPQHREIRALFDTALGLACNGKIDEALGMVDAIIERDAFFAKARTLKGSLLLSAARFDEAQAVCDGILSRDSLCVEAYLMLGVIARHRGHDEAGFIRFREAIYLDASCWLAHFYTAEILFAQGDAKRARSGYDSALRTLEKGAPRAHGQAFFPLSFNAEQFIVICRHKLSLLKENG